MLCPGCGHDFPDSIILCPRCHRYSSPPKRVQPANESRLIEFPRRPRTDSTGEPAPAQQVPAWRAELSERVKAVRAKRASGGSPELMASSFASTGAGAAVAKQPEPAIPDQMPLLEPA